MATLVINHLKIKSPRKGSRKGIKQNHPGQCRISWRQEVQLFLFRVSVRHLSLCFLRPVETPGCQLWKPRWRLIPRRAEVLFTSREYPDAVMTPVPLHVEWDSLLIYLHHTYSLKMSEV